MRYYCNGIPCLLSNILPVERLFLGVLRDSHENACAGVSFFNKVAGLRPAAFVKGRLWRGFFSCGFCGISGGAFSSEHLRKTASVFYSDVLKMDLAILISYWLLVSCVFWRYVSPCSRTAWCLMGVFYFVFIVLTVVGTGRSFLCFTSRWKCFHFALPVGMLLLDMVINIFVGL